MSGFLSSVTPGTYGPDSYICLIFTRRPHHDIFTFFTLLLRVHYVLIASSWRL